jgi:hypothetical protein
VEAEKEGETQPGAEGTVIDMSTSAYDLDAHYCVFNIELTNKQRAALQWYLTVPYGGYTYVYDSQANGLKQFDTESSGYTWIKFRPTSSMDVLAKYRDENSTPKLTKETLRSFDDLKALDENDPTKLKYPWTDGTTTDDDPTSTTPHPYTVFIDEYVYHSDPKDPTISDEGGNEWLWGKYVNQENRKVDLYDESMYPSKDQESYYIPAIYTFSQRSIQTHYADDAQKGTAFGAEHINEVYGLNFAEWGQGSQSDNRNGRYCGYNKFVNTDNLWDTWVDFTTADHIDAATCTWNNLSVDDTTYPVPMLKVYGNDSRQSSYYLNPNTNKVYRAIAGCLNRNRDLDGDNHITAEEYKWYVPTSEEYVQLAIGQTELPSPLIKFGEHFRTEFSDVTWTDYKDKRIQLKYHFFTTDNRYFYADEGMSMGRGQFTMADYAAQTICYEVRCIRQLGLNPSDAPTSGSVSPYESSFTKTVDSDGKIYIESTYFTQNSIRPSTSSYLAPHDPSSNVSLPPKKFEVAKDVCYDITGDDGMKVDGNGYLVVSGGQASEQLWYNSCARNSICSKYTQEENGVDKGTWRVPNIREVSMMRSEGLTSGTDYDLAHKESNAHDGWYLSCTYDYFVNPDVTSGFLYRFFGKRGDEDESVARNILSGYYWSASDRLHVKCVRDVIDEKSNEVDTGND